MRHIFIHHDNENDNVSIYQYESAFVVTLDRADLQLRNIQFSDGPGIYILIGDDDRRYVGQTAGQSVMQRLLQHREDWFTKIMFFGRIDGQLSKTQTDYLEAKMIGYFASSKLRLTNKTAGNSGFFDSWSTYGADELWNNAFEIIAKVANIDLLGSGSRKKAKIAPTAKIAPRKTGNYSAPEGKRFFAKDAEMDATMEIRGGKFVVLAGSKITDRIRVRDASSDLYAYLAKKRASYMRLVEDSATTEDIEFQSPSGAAVFVAGRSENGKTFWRDENGDELAKFLKEVIK